MIDSVGARLRQARELRRLSLQEVSEATKVRTHYLQALENDDLSAIPSAAQARGFLRIYAAFLEFDMGELLASLPREAAPVASSAPTRVPEPVVPEAAPSLWASLRQRLGRRAQKGPAAAVAGAPAEIPASALPAAETPPVAAQPTDQVASTDVKTKASGRSRSDSEDVKKNSVS